MRETNQMNSKHGQGRPGKGGKPGRMGLRNESGSSLVELALIMPIFLVLLIGAAEFGIMAYDSIEVSSAAYAGAAYGAQSGATAANTALIVLAATNDAPNVAGLTATSTSSCACSNGTVITCATASASCVSPGRILKYVQVNTTATVTPVMHLPWLPSVFTLQGQAILRVEK